MKTDFSGNLYIAGSFLKVDSVETGNFAKWDGNKWSAFASGIEGSMSSIDVVSPEKITASVNFKNGDETNANVSVWDGSQWTDIEGTFNDSILEIAVDEDDRIYAVGKFTRIYEKEISGLAIFNGSEWTSTGATFDGGTPSSILVIDSKNVYIAGSIYKMNSEKTDSLLKWDGESWTSLGKSSDIYTIAQDKEGNIYAGGHFSTAGKSASKNIAKWNGSEFVPLALGLNDYVDNIETDRSGNIFIAGRFSGVGDGKANYLARRNGSSWDALGKGTDGTIRSIDIFSNGNIAVGGNFNMAGEVEAKNIAIWDGDKWNALGSGLNSSVSSLSFDSSGGVYTAGNFDTAGNVKVSGLAMWNGNKWEALGAGITSSFLGGLTSTAVDSKDNLYVTGSFFEVGGVDSRDIAKWSKKSKSWVHMEEREFNEARMPDMAYQVEVTSGDIPVFIIGYQRPWPPEFQDRWTALEKYENDKWQKLGHQPFTFTITSDDEIFMLSIKEDDMDQFIGHRLWKLSGTEWTEYDLDLDPGIRTMKYIEEKDVLLVGGDFITMGGVLSPYLAQIRFSEEFDPEEQEPDEESNDHDVSDNTDDADEINDNTPFPDDEDYFPDSENKNTEPIDINGCGCTIIL